jgi:hypothetical protein
MATQVLAQSIGITEFGLPLHTDSPGNITAGPDGALWFAWGTIGRITTTGAITGFPASANGIAAGPDGALWFTDSASNKIGRITTAGVITEYPIPTPGSDPVGIAAGPDGALWFTEYGYPNVIQGKIGRITTAGAITEFPIPTAFSQVFDIAAGPDGALWFTDWGTGNIGRITTGGGITEFPNPVANVHPATITAGPDGALWFMEFNPEGIVGGGTFIGRAGYLTSALLVFPTSNISALLGKKGGPFSVLPSYQVSSSGSLAFSISGLPSWLSASVTSGTATSKPLTVTFSTTPAANTLAPGTYGPATINFTNDTNGMDTQTRTAALVVQPRTNTHDFNGDGYSDLLWNDISGIWAMWLMNGCSEASCRSSG